MKRVCLKYKWKKGAACLFAVGFLAAAALLAAAEEGADAGLMGLFFLMAAAAAAFILVPFRYEGKFLSAVTALLAPPFALCLLESYTHVPQDLTLPIFLLNLAFFYLLYGLMIFLTGRVSMGCILATLVPMLFGLANYFVVKFRSSPIVPWDFYSVGTAATVADNYTFTIEWKTAFVLAGFLWLMLWASKAGRRIKRKAVRIPGAAAALILLFCYAGGIQMDAVQEIFGMDQTLFTMNVLYRNNGIAAAFLGNFRYLKVDEPEGYSADKVKEEEAHVEEEKESGENTLGKDEEALFAEETESTENLETYPNVIVIVDEAFSDLSVYGEFSTNQEVMPFFKSLQEEAVGGNLYVSVKGGNTANTEYEFLTGDTMAFLPSGSVPYQQYIKEDMPNLTSYLKSLGYSTTAIHPYLASGWERDKVYEYFGFDQFLSSSDFADPIRLRGYISDLSAFEKIIEQYENKEEDERIFVYEVTMQNHGGYSSVTPDFDSYIQLTGVTEGTGIMSAEKYLTLMNQTDRALEQLVHYFEDQEEPVILLMFGDHQPSDYITNVIRRITGNTDDGSLENVQLGRRVPFVIWSNYGLDHKTYEGISVNYLSSILMECAGIPLTDYQWYLRELMEELPVVNAVSYMDSQGAFHEYGQENSQEKEILNNYEIIQYNHLFDTENRLNSFFG